MQVGAPARDEAASFRSRVIARIARLPESRRFRKAFHRWWWRNGFRRTEFWKRVAVASVSLLVAFTVCEIAFRVRARSTHHLRADLARAALLVPPATAPDCATVRSAGLGEIVRPSLEHDIVYEPKPNIDTCFYGAHVHTNSDHLRAPVEYSHQHVPGVYRVLFLGDSTTFGQGTENGDTFVVRLQRALSEGGRPTEVINTGVPGYNTAQEAAYLRRTGMSYAPDCVMILYIANDLGLPHLMLPPKPWPTFADRISSAPSTTRSGRRPLHQDSGGTSHRARTSFSFRRMNSIACPTSIATWSASPVTCERFDRSGRPREIFRS